MRESFIDKFDLVVGTSTGGLIALALGAGLTPREIVDFYVREGGRIFRHSRLRVIRQLVGMGSGIGFDDRGTHALKGVPGEWRLFAVA